MSIFDHFDKFEDSRRAMMEIHGKAPKGLDIQQLTPGAIVTVSGCKSTGDRSYLSDFFEVMGVAGSSVLLKALTGWAKEQPPFLLSYYEREWYEAAFLYDAFRNAVGDQQ